jgi:hypothetical protein
MRRSRPLVSTVLGSALAGVLLIPGTVGAAAPTITIQRTVSQFDVTIDYGIDRGASAIARQGCWLRDPSGELTRITCDKTPEESSTTASTEYQRELRVTKAGTHAFVVRFTLTNGRVFSGERSFTIKHGPVTRFSVTGLFDQTVACDAERCPGDWVNDVARQIVKVTARDQYGNRATRYKGTVVFDGFATTVSESTLDRGVGWFAVKPSGLELNQFSNCKSGVPTDQDYRALTVVDKTRPEIRGCQLIFYDLFFVLDLDLPIFRNITPDGCETGCLEDPTDTVVVDTVAKPLKILEVETIELPQGQTSSVLIVGKTAEGQGFTQELTVQNAEVKSNDLPAAVADKCVGCSSPSITIATELDGYVWDDGSTRPKMEPTAVGGELTFNTVPVILPGTNSGGFAPVRVINTGASEPTCYKSYAAALVAVADGVVPCE